MTAVAIATMATTGLGNWSAQAGPESSPDALPAPSPVWTARYDGEVGGYDDTNAAAIEPTTGTVVVVGSSDGPDGDRAVTVAYGPDGGQRWTATVSGAPGSGSYGNAVAVDATRGVVYASGWLGGEEFSDAFLVAYDLAGNEMWRWVTGETDREEAWNRMTVDPASGTVLLTGFTQADNFNDRDILLAAVRPDGTPVWTSVFRGPLQYGPDEAYGIALAPDGSRLFVAGQGLDADATDDGLLLAYDTGTGDLVWETRVQAPGGTLVAALSGLGVSPDGSRIHVSGHIGFSALVQTYDDAGALVWEDRVNGGSGNSLGLLTVDPVSGTFFVAGASSSDFGTTQVIAYTPIGEQLWNRRPARVSRADELPGDLDFDPSRNVLYVGAIQRLWSSSLSRYDVLVLGLDAATGRARGGTRYTGTGSTDQYLADVVLDPARNRLYVAATESYGDVTADLLTLAYRTG